MRKNIPANAGDIRDPGSITGLGRSPGGGHGNPLQSSCLENPHGWRYLAGYSPWDHTKSDMTERLSTVLYQSYTDLYTPHLRTKGGSTEAFG